MNKEAAHGICLIIVPPFVRSQPSGMCAASRHGSKESISGPPNAYPPEKVFPPCPIKVKQGLVVYHFEIPLAFLL
jgi:hypothetical protein